MFYRYGDRLINTDHIIVVKIITNYLVPIDDPKWTSEKQYSIIVDTINNHRIVLDEFNDKIEAEMTLTTIQLDLEDA